MDKYFFAVIPGTIFIFTIILAFLIGKRKYKSKRILTPTNVLAVGIFLTCVAIFIPVYKDVYINDIVWLRWFKTACISIHHAIRLFVVDSDFEIIQNIVSGNKNSIAIFYTVLSALVYVLAPVMTFGFILSFFKNISAYKKYVGCFFRNVYIFSELNSKSIELANSINNSNSKSKFVFTDVFEKNEETTYELIERARELGAICFKKDILSLKLGFHWNGKKMTFFSIGEDENENIKQALSIIKQYGDTKNTELFVLATGKDSELVLSKANYGEHMKVRRINPIRSLTYDLLYNMGREIFDKAASNDSGEKEISAIVLGMGEHGFEMVKALTWFCQMDEYFVRINGFDMDKNAESLFVAKCPELMQDEYNDKHVYDDAKYYIKIHPNMYVGTTEFCDKIKEMKHISYIYVSLGDDKKNIETAINIGAIMKKMGMNPIIQAVVYDSDKNDALQNAKCMGESDKETCKINFVGDLKTIYSEKIILRSKLEKLALERHLNHSAESEFWKYEYNYRSSMASAIHIETRRACGMPGADKPVKERSEEEMNKLRVIEHNRWNAYMRTEGYSFGDKNHVSKTHNLLVPFHQLPPEEKLKDDV